MSPPANAAAPSTLPRVEQPEEPGASESCSPPAHMGEKAVVGQVHSDDPQAGSTMVQGVQRRLSTPGLLGGRGLERRPHSKARVGSKRVPAGSGRADYWYWPSAGSPPDPGTVAVPAPTQTGAPRCCDSWSPMAVRQTGWCSPPPIGGTCVCQPTASGRGLQCGRLEGRSHPSQRVGQLVLIFFFKERPCVGLCDSHALPAHGERSALP